MPKFTKDQIREKFSNSNDFNELFDAFEAALESKIDDLDLYKVLFWNYSLKPDELCLFGEKLVQVFPHIAYDVYLWLAKIFEVTYSMFDNYELALEYFFKASQIKPEEPEPYLAASNCYEPDLNIPPVDYLIEFLKKGLIHVKNPSPLYKRLAELYEKIGDEDQSLYYRKLSQESSTESPEE